MTYLEPHAADLICAAVGAVIAETTDAITFQNSTAFLAILGRVVGVGVAVTPLVVIDSSFTTIFVCFAEDPAAFQQSHPELYAPLVQEWHNLYPDIMVQAGYSCALCCRSDLPLVSVADANVH